MKLWRALLGGQQEISRYSVDQYLTDLSLAFNGSRYLLGSTGAYGWSRTEDVEASFSGYINSIYKSNGVVFAIILARMLLFSEARFCWFDINDNGENGRPAGRDGLDVLEKPWPNGSTGELLSRMEQDVSLGGNFYAVREPNRLRRLRPDWLTIVLSAPPADAIESDVVGYWYHPGRVYSNAGEPTPTDEVYLPDEVCHFSPIPDPDAQYRGMSWLTPVVREVMADKAATDHKLAFFENGATLGVVISAKENLTNAQFKEWKENFANLHTGTRTAYKPLFLASPVDTNVTTATMQQLEFKVTQGAGETRLCAAGGVPPIIVGLSEGLASATYSNYGMARRKFGDGWAHPQWKMASTALSTIVEAPKTDVRLGVNTRGIAFLREDAKDLAEIMQIQAAAVSSFITAGYKPDSAAAAVDANDLTLLVHSGLVSVQLNPPGTGTEPPPPDGAPPEPIDFGALRAEWFDDDDIDRAYYDIRVPEGHEGGGRFRKLSDAVTALLGHWAKGEGDDDPLDQFNREQLRKTSKELAEAATAAGDHERAARLTPRRGASSDEIKLALYKDVRGSVRTQREAKSPDVGKPVRFTLTGGTGKPGGEPPATPPNPKSPWGQIRDLPRTKWSPTHGRPGNLDQVDQVYVSSRSDAQKYLRGLGRSRLEAIADAVDLDVRGLDPDRDRERYVEKVLDGIREPGQDGPLGGGNSKLRNLDVGVFTEPNGKVSLWEVSDRGERRRRVAVADDLAGLEKWANDHGESELADWARKERGVAAGPSPAGHGWLAEQNRRRDDLRRLVAQGGDAKRLPGGHNADVQLVTTAAGTQYVHKGKVGNRGAGVAEDAEELGALVAQAAGARSPTVVRGPDGTLYEDYIPGRTGYAFTGPDSLKVPQEILDSEQGRRQGLADVIMGISDRSNPGNWLMTDGGNLVGIDHGTAFLHKDAPTGNPFTRHLVDRNGSYKANGLSRAELAPVRQRMEELRPEFERLGRLDWWRQSMDRLGEVERHAKAPDVPAKATKPRTKALPSGADIESVSSLKDLTPTQISQADYLTPNGRRALNALGPSGHPRLAAISDPEEKIREAYRMLSGPGAGSNDHYVAFSDMRKLLGDQMSKPEFDNLIRKMDGAPDVHVVPQSYSRGNSAVRIPAAVVIGGEETNQIHIDDPTLARPQDFGAVAMAETLRDRRAGKPGDPMMANLSDAELQAEVDARAARDPVVARDLAAMGLNKPPAKATKAAKKAAPAAPGSSKKPTRTELAAQLADEPGLHPLAARDIRESKGNTQTLRVRADARDSMATAVENNPALGDPALGLTPTGYREMARQLRSAADRIDAQSAPPRENPTFPSRPNLTVDQIQQRRIDAGFSSQPVEADVDTALNRLSRPELVELSDRLNLSQDARIRHAGGRLESIKSWSADKLKRHIREESLGQSRRTTGAIDEGATAVVDTSLDIRPVASATITTSAVKSTDLAHLRTLDRETARDQLDLLKVDQLKPLLREQGLPVSGKKRDLVDRLVDSVHGGAAPNPVAVAPHNHDEHAARLGAPPKPIRQELHAANSTGDVAAETRILARRLSGNHIDVKFDGADPQIAREHAEGILRGLEHAPKTKIARIGTYGPDGSLGDDLGTISKLENEATAVTADRGKPGGATIGFNTRLVGEGKAAELHDHTTDQGYSGWSVKGASDGIYHGVHEFAHAATSDATARKIQEFVDKEAERRGYDYTDELIADEISQYASSDMHELAAEAFTDVVLNGDQASSLSRQIYDMIIKAQR